MAQFNDSFPNLQQAIDVGGERYFMGPEKPIELGFKSRQDYINSFGTDKRTEYLLRKYMFFSLKNKKKLAFDSEKDKSDLITILKKRAKQLKASSEFTSSVLKNTIFQRSYINIEKLVQDLEGAEYKQASEFKLPNIDILPCTKAKKYVKQIPDTQLFQMILEISWYLLHPESVPSNIQCSWAKLIKQLDTLRLGDIVSNIRQAEEAKGIEPSKDAYNYFKKINLENFVKSNSLESALDQVKKTALDAQGDNASKQMKDRLRMLLDILEIKKYLADDLPVDEDRLKIIDVPASDKIKKSMPSNPMRGGAAKALEQPIGIAMKPMYDYFKAVYDPVYTLLDKTLTQYPKNSEDAKMVVIPQLTTILHICNNLSPSETTEGGSNTYGIYRITNVDKEIISFFNNMLASTNGYVSKFAEDKDKNIFNRQLFELPKVRLSSLLNNFLNSSTYKDPKSIPYIQFFTVGSNMELMTKDKFINPKSPELSEPVFEAVNNYFVKDDLYILCTKSENISENIPMNLYQIDYDSIDISETGMKIDNIPNNYFNKNKVPELHLEKLVSLLPYVVFNDAELALSIFLLFKYLLPV